MSLFTAHTAASIVIGQGSNQVVWRRKYYYTYTHIHLLLDPGHVCHLGMSLKSKKNDKS